MQSLRSVLYHWEVTHSFQWDRLSPKGFKRSEVRVKIFSGTIKLFLNLFFFPPPVLMAPLEPSIVGIVVTKAPGALVEKK